MVNGNGVGAVSAIALTLLVLGVFLWPEGTGVVLANEVGNASESYQERSLKVESKNFSTYHDPPCGDGTTGPILVNGTSYCVNVTVFDDVVYEYEWKNRTLEPRNTGRVLVNGEIIGYDNHYCSVVSPARFDCLSCLDADCAYARMKGNLSCREGGGWSCKIFVVEDDQVSVVRVNNEKPSELVIA
jgi:hypothetical protein